MQRQGLPHSVDRPLIGEEIVIATSRPELHAGDRSVIVVGAGAAGLTAASLLVRAGVNVVVVEADASHGGRLRQVRDVVDFPLPLGAEWLHTDPGVLADIAGQPVDIDVVGYGPGDTEGFFDGALTIAPVEDTDRKFVGSSWLDLFDRYVLPHVADRVRYDTRITRIEDTGEGVVVTDERGTVYSADAVIVTVPVTVLRDRTITFVPDLSESKWAAIDRVDVWGGCKAFIGFDTRFYPTFVTFPDSSTKDGQRLYYDAAHGQRTDAHVLGLFAVGAPAAPYQAREGTALRDWILAELDVIFDGAASDSYLWHLTHDWNAAPNVGQAYVSDHAAWRTVRALGKPASRRVLFAGDAYTDGENWSEVHVAAHAAQVAVQRLLEDGVI